MALKLLFFTTVLSILIAASAASHPVRDTNDNPLKPGVQYYIRPAARDVAGGLILAARNRPCPLDVGQATSGANSGLPLSFYPIHPKAQTVNQGVETNIEFRAATTCVQSTVWRLTGPDSGTGRYHVSTLGVRGSPGASTINNWFKIVEKPIGYRIVYCPTVCDTCRPACGNLGIAVEGGRRWLVLSDTAFSFEFVRVGSE